jgi:hypothetical protein
LLEVHLAELCAVETRRVIEQVKQRLRCERRRDPLLPVARSGSELGAAAGALGDRRRGAHARPDARYPRRGQHA